MPQSESGDRALATWAVRLTPPGEGGISLVELSGSDSAAILDRLFVSPRGIRIGALAEGRLAYGRLWREGALLDEVIIECAALPPNASYVVNCHGGAVALRRVLEGLVAEGAFLGEWTDLLERKRQWGLLDTLRAEAAALLPDAATLRGARMLLDQYSGKLSGALTTLRHALDAGQLSEASAGLRALLATVPYGRGLLEPARLVIAGRPNVGKSTLGNALLRHDRLIVHHLPGTTRDTIEELLAVEGVPFLLADTAGMRGTDHEIESEGVKRSREELTRADLALIVFDASSPVTSEDREVIAGAAGRKAIPILNKCDLPRAFDAGSLRSVFGVEPVNLSALTGEGLAELERCILSTMYPAIPPPGAAVLFTRRQEEAVRRAIADIEQGQALAAADCLAVLQGRS